MAWHGPTKICICQSESLRKWNEIPYQSAEIHEDVLVTLIFLICNSQEWLTTHPGGCRHGEGRTEAEHRVRSGLWRGAAGSRPRPRGQVSRGRLHLRHLLGQGVTFEAVGGKLFAVGVSARPSAVVLLRVLSHIVRVLCRSARVLLVYCVVQTGDNEIAFKRPKQMLTGLTGRRTPLKTVMMVETLAMDPWFNR